MYFLLALYKKTTEAWVAGMCHFHVFISDLYRAVCVLYLTLPLHMNPTLQQAHLMFAVSNTQCYDKYRSISTAWVVFPVLYKSVFFPDYLLLINLFFLRGRSGSFMPLNLTTADLTATVSSAVSSDLKNVHYRKGNWSGFFYMRSLLLSNYRLFFFLFVFFTAVGPFLSLVI